MHQNSLHTPLILIGFLLLTLTAYAVPRLTVVVVVDGMTQENLSALRPYWQAGGLRTLSEEVYQTTIDFPHWVYGGQETTATLLTGVTPSQHGIAADTYFNRADRTIHSTLEDRQVEGIGTDTRISPRAILSATLTDEWRMRYGDKARIYALALQPEAAVVMGGHAANACCWLDPGTAKWVASSFYAEGLPAAADAMNMSGRIAEVASRTWTPRMDISMYMRPTEAELKRPFSYTQSGLLLHTPAANSLIVELALALQKAEELGADDTPDILLLQLTTLSPRATADRISAAEHEDMYLGVNQDLGFLMEQLNRRIGREQYQLMVVGRPVMGYSAQALASAGISVRHFNVDKAAALTGTYLMALYGHERWVDGGYGPYLYLNHTLIEQKRLSLETIQRQVANFLMDFEGVQAAYPIHEALLSEYSTSIYRKQAGDVCFVLQDNWVIDTTERKVFDQVVQRCPNVPLLFWSGTLRTFPEGLLHATDVKSLLLR